MAYLLFPVIEPGQGYLGNDPTQLLPQLLDQCIALGETAKQLSLALGGNGDRPEAAKELIDNLYRQE